MDGVFDEDRAFRHEEVRLNDEELAAVEGWRQANMFGSRAEALRELVRLGLLSEIGRIYRAAAECKRDRERSGCT